MPARYDCEICRGRGLIRLPVHHSVRVCIAFEPPATVEANYRDYPCPECGDAIPLERLATVEFHSLIATHIDDPEFIAHAKRHAVQRLAADMHGKSFVDFRFGRTDKQNLTRPMVATIGVVSPTHVASLEKRLALRQEVVAREVVEEATKQILIWGSDYTGSSGPIRKSQAVDSVRTALTRVLAARSNTPRS